MSQVTISSFAKQIGISIDKLLEQLDHAGIKGKGENDLLEDSEKITLLQFLKGEASRETSGRQRITLKRKTTDEIRQTSKTGAARTVHVETRKKRTFVKRSVLEAEQAEEQRKVEEEEVQRKQEIEAERERKEQEILAKEVAEQAERDAEERARQEVEQKEKDEEERLQRERDAEEEAKKQAVAPDPEAETETKTKTKTRRRRRWQKQLWLQQRPNRNPMQRLNQMIGRARKGVKGENQIARAQNYMLRSEGKSDLAEPWGESQAISLLRSLISTHLRSQLRPLFMRFLCPIPLQ